jgi:hypothetical protein
MRRHDLEGKTYEVQSSRVCRAWMIIIGPASHWLPTASACGWRPREGCPAPATRNSSALRGKSRSAPRSAVECAGNRGGGRYEGMGGRGVLRQRESQRVSTVVENDMHPSTPWFGGIGRRAVKTQVEDAQYGRTVRVRPSTQQSVSLTRYTRSPCWSERTAPYAPHSLPYPQHAKPLSPLRARRALFGF